MPRARHLASQYIGLWGSTSSHAPLLRVTAPADEAPLAQRLNNALVHRVNAVRLRADAHERAERKRSPQNECGLHKPQAGTAAIT